MKKQLSAVLAAAAGVALISLSAAAAGEQSAFPFSVNESGPVLTAQQQQYQDEWAAKRDQGQGVAGRPGFASEGSAGNSSIHEVQTPSRGGPMDD